MSRSVAVPSDALVVAYAAFECDDADEARFEFSACLNDAQNYIRERHRGYTLADRWFGGECRVIAENSQTVIGVSEYCGLVSV